MVTKKEVIFIAVGIVLFSLLIMFNNSILNTNLWLNALITSAVIILVSVVAKKITAYKIDTKIDIKFFELKRYWITTTSVFKKAIPIGVFLPVILSFLTGGFVKFLAFFQFEAEALPSKVSKRYGVRRYSTVLEWDYALIIFYSTLALLALSVLCKYFSSYSVMSILPLKEIARYSLYYCLYNLIPFGQLDGMKIYMSSKPLYITSLILAVATCLIVFL
jgi:hypothetical protein